MIWTKEKAFLAIIVTSWPTSLPSFLCILISKQACWYHFVFSLRPSCPRIAASLQVSRHLNAVISAEKWFPPEVIPSLIAAPWLLTRISSKRVQIIGFVGCALCNLVLATAYGPLKEITALFFTLCPGRGWHGKRLMPYVLFFERHLKALWWFPQKFMDCWLPRTEKTTRMVGTWLVGVAMSEMVVVICHGGNETRVRV